MLDEFPIEYDMLEEFGTAYEMLELVYLLDLFETVKGIY
jgi:hypothetical protein